MRKIAIWCTKAHPIQDIQKMDLFSNHGIDEIINISDLNIPFQADLDNSPIGKKNLKELAKKLIEYLIKLYPNCNIVIVQPSGSPAFQYSLGSIADNYKNIETLYAHSERVSEDVVQPDGTIKKLSVFKHVCFE